MIIIAHKPPRNVTIEVTEKELFELTENLLAKDENNCGKYFKLNLQGKRNGQKDTSENPLFANVNSTFLRDVPTIKKLLALQDNYVSVRIGSYLLHFKEKS